MASNDPEAEGVWGLPFFLFQVRRGDMARFLRLEFAGAPYHVTRRANRRQRTFFRDEDFAEYRWLLSASCRACGTQVLADCLMPNCTRMPAAAGRSVRICFSKTWSNGCSALSSNKRRGRSRSNENCHTQDFFQPLERN